MKISRQRPSVAPASPEAPSAETSQAPDEAPSNATAQESLKAVTANDDYRDARNEVGAAVQTGAAAVATGIGDGFDSPGPMPDRPPIMMKYGILPMGPRPGMEGCPPMKLEDRIRPFQTSLGPGPPTPVLMYGIPPLGRDAAVQNCPPLAMKYGIHPPGLDLPMSAPVIMPKYGIMPGPPESAGGER